MKFLHMLFLLSLCCLIPSPLTQKACAIDRENSQYDVVLMPEGDFPLGICSDLAGYLSQKTALRVKVVMPLGTRDWKPFGKHNQYDPNDLRDLAIPVISRLKSSYGGDVYIILTLKDINPAGSGMSFVFAQHYTDHGIAVISTSRMLLGLRGAPQPEGLFLNRIRKMLLRTVAFDYYQIEGSTDINEVTYGSLMSLRDLDEMGFVLNAKGKR